MKKITCYSISALALVLFSSCGRQVPSQPTLQTPPQPTVQVDTASAGEGYFQANPDTQPGPVTYNGKTYVYTGEIHKPGADNVLPCDPSLLASQDATLSWTECYVYKTDKYPDGILLKYSQQSYLLFTPQTVPVVVATAPSTVPPVVKEPSTEATPVAVTKSPTDESVSAGGTARFSAHADNADSIYWIFTPPDNSNVFSSAELHSLFPSMGLQELSGDIIELSNVPLEMDGWKLQARFSSGISYADSNYATLSVSP